MKPISCFGCGKTILMLGILNIVDKSQNHDGSNDKLKNNTEYWTNIQNKNSHKLAMQKIKVTTNYFSFSPSSPPCS